MCLCAPCAQALDCVLPSLLLLPFSPLLPLPSSPLLLPSLACAPVASPRLPLLPYPVPQAQFLSSFQCRCTFALARTRVYTHTLPPSPAQPRTSALSIMRRQTLQPTHARFCTCCPVEGCVCARAQSHTCTPYTHTNSHRHTHTRIHTQPYALLHAHTDRQTDSLSLVNVLTRTHPLAALSCTHLPIAFPLYALHISLSYAHTHTHTHSTRQWKRIYTTSNPLYTRYRPPSRAHTYTNSLTSM